MSLGSSILDTPPANTDGQRGTGNLDTQLASLMEDYLHATRLQNSLKKRIKQLLKEREVEARRKEDEAREALHKAEEERKAMENASALMKEKMKQAEILDDEEKEEEEKKVEVMEKEEIVPAFATSSPMSIDEIKAREIEEEIRAMMIQVSAINMQQGIL
jgi:hypothetical protein